MNKIAQYLNSNLSGEVLSTAMVRLKYSRDRSILRLVPDSVVLPRNTDDVRKVAKLAYQLSEKGKTLGLTARGRGHSQTGAAIGKDIVIDFSRHLNQVLDIDPNQGLIHVQAGVEIGQINTIAKSHGLCLPFEADPKQSIAGLISSNNARLNFTKIKDLSQSIDQLEIVLANGDLIQTRRLNKRELAKKLGQAGPEGEIYRQIDQLIEEHGELLNSIDTSRCDNAGYHSLALVKQKDGSFDLSPLFIGAQGTLGFITEVIIKLDLRLPENLAMAASFLSVEDAMDAQEEILKLKPAYCNIYHASILANAIESGKTFSFFDQAFEAFAQTPSVCLNADFHLKNKHQAKIIAKKINKIVNDKKGFVALSNDKNLTEFTAIKDIPLIFSNTQRDVQNVALLNGIQVPLIQFREFVNGLAEIGNHLNLPLPYYGSCYSGIMNLQTEFNLKSIGDKQKVFRLLNSVSKLVNDTNGILCAGEAEGRIKTPFVYPNINNELRDLFIKVRQSFDGQHILNPGVKEALQLKELIANTVNDYYNGVFY